MAQQEGGKLVIKILKNIPDLKIQCSIIMETITYSSSSISFLASADDGTFSTEMKQDPDNPILSTQQIVMFAGKIFQSIIIDKTFVADYNDNISNGVTIKFSHKLLICDCSLFIPKEKFTKQYTNIQKNMKNVVISMLNDMHAIKKTVNNPQFQCTSIQVSRNAFIKSGLWKECPFDIHFSEDDVYKKNGDLRKGFAEHILTPAFQLLHPNIKNIVSVKDNKTKIFADQSFVNYGASSYYNDINKFFRKSIHFIKNKEIKVNFDSYGVGLKLLRINGTFYLKGMMCIKPPGVAGSSLIPQNYQYNSNRSTLESFSIKSMNNLIFGNKLQPIGVIPLNTLRLESRPFISRYQPYIGYGGTVGYLYCDVVHTILVKNGIIFLQRKIAFQGSSATDVVPATSLSVNYFNKAPQTISAHNTITIQKNGNPFYFDLRLF